MEERSKLFFHQEGWLGLFLANALDWPFQIKPSSFNATKPFHFANTEELVAGKNPELAYFLMVAKRPLMEAMAYPFPSCHFEKCSTNANVMHCHWLGSVYRWSNPTVVDDQQERIGACNGKFVRELDGHVASMTMPDNR